MAGAKMGLGGGLSNLFGSDTSDLMEESLDNGTKNLPLAKIEPNPDQPRKVFDQVSLDELAESIRLHGVITPITVRKGEKDGYYQIIAGERRWRAARQAGLEDIPAMVLEAEEDEVMELALIENLQRQDLNPIEEAEGYERLMKQFGLTQEQVAKRVVKSRSAVANALRLLALPTEVRTMVSEGEISGGHARAVLAVNEADKRVEAARQMVGLSVRQSEALAKRMNKKPVEKPEQSPEVSVDYIAELEKELEELSKKGDEDYDGKYTNGTMFWPVPTVRNISSGFGSRWGTVHRGIDIANGSVPIYGEKIYAAESGTVIYSNYTSTWGGGYGYYCIVDHGLDSKGRRISTLYAHTSKMYARVGDKVTRGKTVLALAGDTGNVTGPHLHFEVRVNGVAVDPIKNGYVSLNK